MVFLFSMAVSAHSQSPTKLKEISLTGHQLISVKIGNEEKKAAYFDIELDDYIIKENLKIGAQNSRVYSIVIRDIEPSVINHHKLCSISVPEKGALLRTRICTKIKLLYPKNKIQTLTGETDER
ncbi:hypothetical protein [Vibrio nigripulchritudo]|uniref:Uncharacterized protein n=1 Tax=Vibrio nigripulchritudo TaxID=28173 RepID=A0A9P1JM91_9VIBR|nr:hypothetical protein [Vibrio nigripulchritudo]CBJ93215.1 Protein of unknown function [Vibrio nigripulchritudo]CCO56149.1 hypothetical protein VIBNIWn13_p0199 [Vibrio nigripulchritudo Wn13]